MVLTLTLSSNFFLKKGLQVMKICVHFFLFQLDTLLPLKFQIFSSLPFLFHSGSRGAQSSNLNATQHGRQHREQRCQEESVRNMFQLKRKCFLGASCWDLKSELFSLRVYAIHTSNVVVRIWLLHYTFTRGTWTELRLPWSKQKLQDEINKHVTMQKISQTPAIFRERAQSVRKVV